MTSSESESVSESSDFVPSTDDTEDETSGSENSDSNNDERNENKSKVAKQKFILQSNLLSTPKRINTKNKPMVIHKDFVSRSQI